MNIDSVPTHVTQEQAGDLCRSLGFDPGDLLALRMTPAAITVDIYARNEQGQRWMTDDGRGTTPATHRLHIPIRSDEKQAALDAAREGPLPCDSVAISEEEEDAHCSLEMDHPGPHRSADATRIWR